MMLTMISMLRAGLVDNPVLGLLPGVVKVREMGRLFVLRSGPVDANPVITSIADVPDDQGGRVYLTFQRSMLDVSAHPNGIDTYTIQRFDSTNWVGLGSIGALGEPSYMFEATTLIDSLGQGNDSTIFRLLL